jgi:hypothetical protein
MENKFEIGSLVYLKHGGRLMVVSEIQPEMITCVFCIEGHRKINECKTHVSLLEIYNWKQE